MTGTSDTHARILDAALRVMTRAGLAKLTLEAVAEEAATSRQTVYRYFGSRDALVTAVILREEEDFLERVSGAGANQPDLRAALHASLNEAFRAAREHPLLHRLLATEPHLLLPFLTTGAGPVLTAARPALATLLAAHHPDLDDEVVGHAADVLTRLFISYALNPAAEGDDAVADALTYLVLDGLTGARAIRPADQPAAPGPTIRR